MCGATGSRRCRISSAKSFSEQVPEQLVVDRCIATIWFIGSGEPLEIARSFSLANGKVHGHTLQCEQSPQPGSWAEWPGQVSGFRKPNTSPRLLVERRDLQKVWALIPVCCVLESDGTVDSTRSQGKRKKAKGKIKV